MRGVRPSVVKRQLVQIEMTVRQKMESGNDYRRYRDAPIRFAREVLKVELTPTQKDVLRKCLLPPYRILVPSANEQGKTLLAAVLTLWWICTRKPVVIITTAPKADQIKKLVWKEIRKLAKRAKLDLPFQPKACLIERAPNDFAAGATARDATAFQGHHGPNQLFIFDEAIGIEPEFWEATEGMFSPPGHLWVCFFNPTDPAAQCYRELVQAGKAEKRGAKSWWVVRMSALLHPNIAAELQGLPAPVPGAMRVAKFERLLKKWSQIVLGKPLATDVQWPPEWATAYIERTQQDPRWYRPGPIAEARLLGLFPSQGSYNVWSEGDWIAATREGMDPLPLPDDVLPEIGADIARFGDDWTEVHARQGPCSVYHDGKNGMSTVETAERIKTLCQELSDWFNNEVRSLRAGSLTSDPRRIPIKIDDDGVGGGVSDILIDAGYNVIRVSAASRAFNPSEYPNRRSELWFDAAELARNDRMDLSRLPEEVLDELQQQAMAPQWWMVSKKRVVEPKDSMKQRLGRSPDSMDALNLCFAEYDTDDGTPTVIAERHDPAGFHTPQVSFSSWGM